MSAPVAVILGASANRAKFGNKSVRAHQAAGYHVVPVHPTEREVEGLPTYPSIASVPGPIDRVSLYLPPAVVLGELEAIAAARPREVWLNPGTSSPEILTKGKTLGLNLIPGCSIVDLGVSPSQFPDS